MFRDLADIDRRFIGRRAIERELADKTSRWKMVGLMIDWRDWDRHYGEAGLIPPKDEHPVRLRDDAVRRRRKRVGYTTSFMYSPMLQRHIAMARVRPDLAKPGSQVNLEFTINHRYHTVARRTSPARRCSTRRERQPDAMTSTTSRYDAIVIGGGHNGLVNGAYLAKSGLRTLIIERRHIVGGAAITEELIPGFHFTTFSYALSLLRPDIIHDLELTKHGFMPIQMPSPSLRWRTATTC